MMLYSAAIAILHTLTLAAAVPAEPIDIGSRLELMVDDFLIDAKRGPLRLQIHQPVRREIVFKTDAPWEGNASGYQSVFQDGKLYRMYYRGLHYRHSGPPAQALPDHPWNLCYAESDDGLHWRRPKLGICEFNGSKDNNIILTPTMLKEVRGDPAHSAVLLDANPNCPADAKYKVILLGRGGLFALKSGDGVHFTLMSDKPIITEGAFDSQNLVFWDPLRCEYREYHRGFKNGVRDIMTAASKDVLHFPKPQWLDHSGARAEHLYPNQIQPYYRAPHIFLGFPMRYNDRGWSEPTFDLPGLEERLVRAKSHPRYGTAVTDAVLISSRDGLKFHRWGEAFIRPGPRQRHSWVYGDNFVFWGMFETKSTVEDTPKEISLYATESYWEGMYTSVRRYTLRLDGFVSAYAPLAGGEFVTKPIRFDGGNLALNVETSGAGGIQVEIQDLAGKPLEGYALADCPPIFCDRVQKIVRWKGRGGDVRPLSGKPVRLRFVLNDADLYSFQFLPYQADPPTPQVNAPKAKPKKPAAPQPKPPAKKS